MTVPTTSNRVDFTVIAGMGPVTFLHRLDEAEELQLWVLDDDGFKALKARPDPDYTVAIAADFNSATVTLAPAFIAENLGKNCVLLRDLPLTQDLNVEQVQRFSDGQIEKGFDRSVMRDQQIAARVGDMKQEILAANEAASNIDAAAEAVAAAASATAAAASAAAAQAAPKVSAESDWFQYG